MFTVVHAVNRNDRLFTDFFEIGAIRKKILKEFQRKAWKRNCSEVRQGKETILLRTQLLTTDYFEDIIFA